LARRLKDSNQERDRSTIQRSFTGVNTFLAAALGDRACRMGYHVGYYNMQKLLDTVKRARLERHEIRFFDKMMKCDLLFLTTSV